jgi:hypothetical protein
MGQFPPDFAFSLGGCHINRVTRQAPRTADPLERAVVPIWDHGGDERDRTRGKDEIAQRIGERRE